MTYRLRRQLILIFVLSAVICSCAAYSPDEQRPLLSLPSSSSSKNLPSATHRKTRGQVVQTALDMIGVPYLYGGRSPSGFDCSGLVHYSYSSASVDVPRTSRDQLAAATRISLDEAKRGDLLFFQSINLSHVAIYLGDGKFVHAPSSGKRVEQASLTLPYYRKRLVAVGRLLP